MLEFPNHRTLRCHWEQTRIRRFGSHWIDPVPSTFLLVQERQLDENPHTKERPNRPVAREPRKAQSSSIRWMGVFILRFTPRELPMNREVMSHDTETSVHSARYLQWLGLDPSMVQSPSVCWLRHAPRPLPLSLPPRMRTGGTLSAEGR